MDEPHGVVRPAVAVRAQAIHGHDAGVLESPGNLGLDEEPLAADQVVGVVVEDLLEGDFPVQLAIQGDKDGTQPALGVGPQGAEAARRPLGGLGRRDLHPGQGGIDQPGVAREPGAILRRVGSLSGRGAVLQLHRQQLPEQGRAVRPGGAGQAVLDGRPAAGAHSRPRSGGTPGRSPPAVLHPEHRYHPGGRRRS